MAHLAIDDVTVALALSRAERFWALHGDITVPRSDVESIEHVDDLWPYLRGIRAPGTGFPGVIMLGTKRGRGYRDFCAVYGKRPGTIVSLGPGAACGFQRLLVSDPRSARLFLRFTGGRPRR